LTHAHPVERVHRVGRRLRPCVRWPAHCRCCSRSGRSRCRGPGPRARTCRSRFATAGCRHEGRTGRSDRTSRVLVAEMEHPPGGSPTPRRLPVGLPVVDHDRKLRGHVERERGRRTAGSRPLVAVDAEDEVEVVVGRDPQVRADRVPARLQVELLGGSCCRPILPSTAGERVRGTPMAVPACTCARRLGSSAPVARRAVVRRCACSRRSSAASGRRTREASPAGCLKFSLVAAVGP